MINIKSFVLFLFLSVVEITSHILKPSATPQKHEQKNLMVVSEAEKMEERGEKAGKDDGRTGMVGTYSYIIEYTVWVTDVYMCVRLASL